MDIQHDGPRLVLAGDFDGRSTSEVRKELHSLLAAPEPEIVVDLTEVSSVDVPALRVLAFASRLAARAGGRVTLCGAGPSVRRMLHLTGMIRFVELDRAVA